MRNYLLIFENKLGLSCANISTARFKISIVFIAWISLRNKIWFSRLRLTFFVCQSVIVFLSHVLFILLFNSSLINIGISIALIDRKGWGVGWIF